MKIPGHFSVEINRDGRNRRPEAATIAPNPSSKQAEPLRDWFPPGLFPSEGEEVKKFPTIILDKLYTKCYLRELTSSVHDSNLETSPT